MKSFKVEDKNFYKAILPVLEQCFEIVNHPDRYHRGIFYHLSKNWSGDIITIAFFSFSKEGLCNPIISLTNPETDILYKFGGEKFAEMIEHYFSPTGDVSMGMIDSWGYETSFLYTTTKEKCYVNFINLNPDDVDEIHEFDK